jgi:hypothetical protein
MHQQQEQQLLNAFRRLSGPDRKIVLGFVRQYVCEAPASMPLKLVINNVATINDRPRHSHDGEPPPMIGATVQR